MGTPQGSHDGNVPVATNKTHNLALQRGFSRGGKKTVRYATFLSESSELRENRAYDYGCNSASSLRDVVGSSQKKNNSSAFGTVYDDLNLHNSVHNCPNLYSSLHTRVCNTVSRWYRTVHVPWLVASYDMHKGKHWMNSKPHATWCVADVVSEERHETHIA